MKLIQLKCKECKYYFGGILVEDGEEDYVRQTFGRITLGALCLNCSKFATSLQGREMWNETNEDKLSN